jgi:hypothetical protein
MHSVATHVVTACLLTAAVGCGQGTSATLYEIGDEHVGLVGAIVEDDDEVLTSGTVALTADGTPVVALNRSIRTGGWLCLGNCTTNVGAVLRFDRAPVARELATGLGLSWRPVIAAHGDGAILAGHDALFAVGRDDVRRTRELDTNVDSGGFAVSGDDVVVVTAGAARFVRSDGTLAAWEPDAPQHALGVFPTRDGFAMLVMDDDTRTVELVLVDRAGAVRGRAALVDDTESWPGPLAIIGLADGTVARVAISSNADGNERLLERYAADGVLLSRVLLGAIDALAPPGFVEDDAEERTVLDVVATERGLTFVISPKGNAEDDRVTLVTVAVDTGDVDTQLDVDTGRRVGSASLAARDGRTVLLVAGPALDS